MQDEESLFVAALDLPPGEPRRAFLDAACAGSPALRARLGRLLEADERASSLLDRPAAGPPGLAGMVVAGRYRLLEEIGEGGMGSVWLAEQTEPVRRRVALKLVRPGMDTRPLLARFEAERQALALMDHPNIARVFDGGTAPDGRPFFAMEYVQGIPITQFCDDHRLGVAERLGLFLTVCRAVQHAHTKGVIHRDLKPGNILVSPRDGRPEPTVIDFGLAKAIGTPLAESTLHTAPGAALGTPLYMSPEQADSGNLDVDARADVYALGVILYELLTGSPPLERRRFREAAWDEVLRLIREEEPPRPSARLSGSESLPSLAALRRTEPLRLARLVRGDLDWIVMKCLEKDRERRYETPSGLARDISRYLTDESVEARPPSAGYRLRKFLRRNRGLAAALTAVFLLLVGGIVGTTWGLVRAEKARRAEAARALGERKANAQAQARLKQVREANDLLASVFDDLDPTLETNEGKPLRVILAARLVHAATQLDGERMGDRLAVADLQARIGRSLHHLGEPGPAVDVLKKAAATRTQLLGTGHVQTLEAVAHLAEAHGSSGRPDLSLPILERAVEVGRSNLGPDHEQTLLMLNSLATAHLESGRPDLALPIYEETLRTSRKTLGVDHPHSVVVLNNLAVAYQSTNRPDRAVPLLRESFERMRSELGPSHHDTLTAMTNLATALRASGEPDQAIATLQEVVRLLSSTLGPDHPSTLGALNNLAGSHRTAGDLDRALATYREAADGVARRRFQVTDARIIVFNLIGSLEERGRFAEAETWRRKWLPVLRTTVGADSPALADELRGLGFDLIRQERWEAAESPLRDSLAIRLLHAPDSIDAHGTRALLGRALAGQGKHEEAEFMLRRAYEGLEARGEPPTEAGRRRARAIASDLARLHEARGNPGLAAPWRERAGTAGAMDLPVDLFARP
jgi:serine/threonine protein kinase/tetratricopeptide (TPR) repeat protein